MMDIVANASIEKIKNALALLGKGAKNAREMRTLIFGLEAAMQEMPEYVKGCDFKTTHHFGPGVYMREALIPKGFVVTGKIHKTGHLNILSQGRITVWTEEGMKTLEAPAIIRSESGIKRVGYAHEDSIWVTVHKNQNDEKEIKKVEERLFADSFDEAYLGSSRSFEDAIRFLGFTPNEVSALSENEKDQIPFPEGTCGLVVSDSPIHGKGLFATKSFNIGEVIAPARIIGLRTPAGRYSNHSSDPNSEVQMRESGDCDLVAIKKIESGSEILNDYYLNFTKSRFPLEGDKLCQHL